MYIKYDPEVNAAKIYLLPPGIEPRTARMYACDPIAVDGMINLDFDEAGRLIGIEVLAARSLIHADVLALADQEE
jgi:uncharacterized protein YuzE